MILLLLFACTGPGDKVSPAETGGPDDSDSAPVDDTSSPTDTGEDTGEDTVDVSALAAMVSADELRTSVEDLAGFGTRHLAAENHDEVRDYLVGRLEELGLAVETDPFSVSGVSAGGLGYEPESSFSSSSRETAGRLKPGPNRRATQKSRRAPGVVRPAGV